MCYSNRQCLHKGDDNCYIIIIFSTAVKKDIKLSDVIKKVKNRIGHEWKSLARGLGLNTSEIAAIEYDNRFSLKEQIAQLFIHWERTEGPLEATPQALVNGLMKENLTGILEFLERDGYVENIGNVIN